MRSLGASSAQNTRINPWLRVGMLPLREQLERAATSELLSRGYSRFFRSWVLEEGRVRRKWSNVHVVGSSGQTDEIGLPRGNALDRDQDQDEEDG
jgi:hypothetical protein